MINRQCIAILGTVLAAVLVLATPGFADCGDLPDHADLLAALNAVVVADNGGLGFQMYAALLDRSGQICQIARSDVPSKAGLGPWPGSRVISAQKANTANAFSVDLFALSTANAYAAVQPGGPLFGLQFSNPVDPQVAYGDPKKESKDGLAELYGTPDDPMVGEFIGGINVFGGGLALYDAAGNLLGAIGVSGDTSCTDHAIGWKVRDQLALDYVPGGVADGFTTDNVVFDFVDDAHGNPESASGWGHPSCTSAAANVTTPDPALLVAACPVANGSDGPACAGADLD